MIAGTAVAKVKIVHFVGFKVYREFFGVPIEKVKEIVRVPEITPVPETPEFVEGVINLRGKIIAVIDMRKRLGAPPASGGGRERANRVLILELDGKTVGLIVDSASEIMKIPADSIEPPPELVASIGAEYITGVGKLDDKLVVMLDLSRLLSAEEIKKVEAISDDTKGGSPKMASLPEYNDKTIE